MFSGIVEEAAPVVALRREQGNPASVQGFRPD